MNLSVIKPLPSTEEIIQAFPLSEAAYENVARDKQEVKDILNNRDIWLDCDQVIKRLKKREKKNEIEAKKHQEIKE